MKKLIIELMEKGVLKKSESQALHSDRIEEFLEVLVLLCNKLDTEVPLWTYKEEKILLKKKKVCIPVDDAGNLHLRIYIIS